MTTEERAALYMLRGIPCERCNEKTPALEIDNLEVVEFRNLVRVKVRCYRKKHPLGRRTLKLNELRYAVQTRLWQP